MKQENSLSRQDSKLIRHLALAKNRRKEGLFVAEGPKLITDLLTRFSCALLVASEASIQDIALSESQKGRIERLIVLPTHYDFSAISMQKSPRPLLALFHYREPEVATQLPMRCTLLLDCVQDPGNVGTILRTADWFGIRDIWMTEGTADCFAPKVVQATMGALARIQLRRIDADSPLWKAIMEQNVPIIGTFLKGAPLSQCTLPSPDDPALIIMGNEGKGISPSLQPYITQAVTIPPYSASEQHGESLNVAVAAAIMLSKIAE